MPSKLNQEQSLAPLKLLEETAEQFLRFDSDGDGIYDFIASKLKLFSKASYVIIDTIENDYFSVNRSIVGISDHLPEVISILGFHPSNIKIQYTKDTFEQLKSGKFEPCSSLYELISGQISGPTSIALEQLLQIGEIYRVGFMRMGKVVGSAALLFRRGSGFEKRSLTEAFVKQASIAMQIKVSEEKLKKSESSYKRIFENAMIGIYQTDIIGNILNANPAFYNLFGYDSSEEFLGINATHTYPLPEKREEFINLIERDGVVIQFENTGVKKDGTFIHFFESARKIYDPVRQKYIYEGSIMDITQLKSMMKEIIEKNKRLEYIANIHSHKIRAPLARVLGLMHLLQIDAQHLSEYLDMLKTECHRLDSIVHEILNLTYIEE